MKHLRYPTVDLFLYDLSNGFGSDNAKVEQSFARFWQRIDRNLSPKELENRKAVEKTFASYVELLGDQRLERFKHPWDGYYYPVKLGDTYALQVDCAGKTQDQDWDRLPLEEQLRQTKTIILDHINDTPGGIGEDWLIWGQRIDPIASQNEAEVLKEYCQLAEACYGAIAIVQKPNWRNELKGHGTFRGTFLFELERPDYIPDGVNRSAHTLICLFPPDQTEGDIQQAIGQLYRSLIRLFHYRNKVLWAYEQSRQIKEALKTASKTIQKLTQSLAEHITTSKLDLERLQRDLADALSISHYYETNLGYLKEQAATIEINTENYKKRVQEIQKLGAKADRPTDLEFLERFGTFAEESYLAQIETDYQSLSAGLQPLENFIKTVQGITELERTKNDRAFNQTVAIATVEITRTVAIATVGVSTASLAASLFSNQADTLVKTFLPVPDKQPMPSLNAWLNFWLPFALSVAIGLMGAGITWVLLKQLFKVKPKP